MGARSMPVTAVAVLLVLMLLAGVIALPTMVLLAR
jgi:hypothetical protein